MKSILILTVAAMLSLSMTALADVKIKTKQTITGQTTENTTYIKGKRQRTEMMGGVMVTVTQCDLGRDLQINPGSKTYMVNLYDDGTVAATTPVKNEADKAAAYQKGGTMFVTTTIKDTGERKQMFGYTARHIIQTIETETSPDACLPTKSKMEMDMWVIDAEFGIACTQTRQYRPYNGGKSSGCHDKIVPKTIGSAKSGYPVWQKMTSYDANGRESFSTIQEVIELSKATLDQALFEAPADYREVKDSAQLYAATSGTGDNSYKASTSNAPSSGMAASIKNATAPVPSAETGDASAATPAAKKPGTVRVGVTVKTASVGEGITTTELAAAIQNTLGSYMKGTKVEIVALEAKLAAAQAGEAKEKECDFVLNLTAAHKKGGGGGFGGFGKMLGTVVSQTGIGHTGSVAGNIAGQIATTAIVSATSVSANVKSKDELSLDLKLQSAADGSSMLAKQLKVKAKADGDDIISAIIEQAAQAILDSIK